MAIKSVFTAVKKLEKRVKGILEVKIATENILIARILVYSAMKIKAKGPLLYSVLKPDTSSDSPSARSKGVRFVSAREVINQRRKTGRHINAGQEKL